MASPKLFATPNDEASEGQQSEAQESQFDLQATRVQRIPAVPVPTLSQDGAGQAVSEAADQNVTEVEGPPHLEVWQHQSDEIRHQLQHCVDRPVC